MRERERVCVCGEVGGGRVNMIEYYLYAHST